MKEKGPQRSFWEKKMGQSCHISMEKKSENHQI
jgi:hypothetical protein